MWSWAPDGHQQATVTEMLCDQTGLGQFRKKLYCCWSQDGIKGKRLQPVPCIALASQLLPISPCAQRSNR